MKNKITNIVLALIFLWCTFTIASCGNKQKSNDENISQNAQENHENLGEEVPRDDNGFTLNPDGLSYSVTGRETCEDTNVIIPSEYKGLPVTAIGAYAFFNCESLTNVIIPNSVTSIGYSAFEDCSSLVNIEFSNKVTFIGDNAFYGCSYLMTAYYNGTEEEWEKINIGMANSNLTSATIYYDGETKGSEGLVYTLNDDETSYSVTGIGSCQDSQIIIPPKHNGLPVTAIGKSAFSYKKNITSVTISKGISSIGQSAFLSCNNLRRVAIPGSVESIEEVAFYGCDKLTKIIISDGVVSLEKQVFYACKGLVEIIIPKSVTSIGSYAFESCFSLNNIKVEVGNLNYTSIDGNLYNKDATTLIQYASGKKDLSFTIPNGVTSLDYHAFYNCDNLTSIIVPNTLASLPSPSACFENCDNLTSILVEDGNPNYTSIDGNLYNKDVTELILYIAGKTNSSFVIPSTVTTIGDAAFADCDNLTSITIPNSVTFIGEAAFSSCDRLITITIPKGVTSIENSTFMNCDSLRSIVIPNSVTSIGDNAFYYCSYRITVYYGGSTVREWYGVKIGDNNAELTLGTIYYYSESEPTSSGNFWHYDDNGAIIVW